MSRTVEVALDPPYAVRIGAGTLGEVRDVVGERSCAVLTDGHVAGLHGERLAAFGDSPWIQVPRGEAAKTFSELERVLGDMAAADLDRGSALITLGGGSISDLGGLAASLYMRGIDVVHCPTTLLAQVDAALGGKTAVNTEAGRNLVGTFHQPRAVFADVETLDTLEPSEGRSGLGEVVKSALLGADGLFGWLEESADRLLAHERDALEHVVAGCCALKASVVASDAREGGPRKQLNLGHTFAHALERAAGYGRLPHGVAVAVGLTLALDCSARMELLEDPGLPARAADLLDRLGVTRSLSALREQQEADLSAAAISAAMRHDKKSRGAEPRFVLLRRIGQVELDVAVEPDTLSAVLA